ncbi:MAG: hypothetical protein EOP83_35250, partial [Verrucomicrobiaceae bacterium]
MLLGAGAAAAPAYGRTTGSETGDPPISITDFGARPEADDNRQAIEKAIAAALASGRTVLIPVGKFRYSRIDFGRNDAASPTRLLITGVGTLVSTFRGTSMIASRGPFYDLVIDGVRFESVEGAGTALIDGDSFIRLIFTPGTQIRGFDWVIRGEQALQSIRMMGCIVRGG